MTYVISDLHGQYNLFLKMLNKINFSESDTMYILGDVFDRGPDSFKIMEYITENKNINLILGNHDYHANLIFRSLYAPLHDGVSKDDVLYAFADWTSDGGDSTYKEFKTFGSRKALELIKTIQTLEHRATIDISGKHFHLSHTLPPYEKFISKTRLNYEDFLYDRIDYDKVYDENTIFITGHTPTGIIDEQSQGKIWKGNGHIAIDCGAFYTGTLGCICLDNDQEYYVNKGE